MASESREFTFQKLAFTQDESVVSLTFAGYEAPIELQRGSGTSSVTLGFTQTRGEQRLVMDDSNRTIMLNYPLMVALQDWLEPAP